MRLYLRSISIVALLLMYTCHLQAQEVLYIDSIGATNKYSAMIELPKAYLSGVCILKMDEQGVVMGCLFNEFGISALEFSYRPGDKKVKLLSVIKMMDKWYIRRVLKRDLVKVYQQLLDGKTTYVNERFHITYTLKTLKSED